MNKTKKDKILIRLTNLSTNELKIIFTKMYKNKKCPISKKDIISKLCSPLYKKYRMKRTLKNNVSIQPYKKGKYDITTLRNMFANLSLNEIQTVNILPIKFTTNNKFEVPTKENRHTWEHSDCNNGYMFKEIIGKGSDGWVYKATKDSNTVAIKVVNLSSDIYKNTNTNKNLYVTKKQSLEEFRNEIKIGLIGQYYGISPKIYDFWICRYRPSVTIKKLPNNSKPNKQSLLDYQHCSDTYPKFNPFGNGCRNVDTGFVVMETLPITFYDYIKEKNSKGKFIQIARQLGNMINIIEKSIFYLGIVAYDAHLENWMLNNDERLYMTDFGRILHIKDIYKDVINSVKVGSEVVIFSDIQSNHNETLKIGTIIKNTGNYWRIKTRDNKIISIIKTNVFPADQFNEKMLRILKNVIRESVCHVHFTGPISTNPVNPIMILCKIFKNFNITIEYIINLKNLMFNWDNGLDYDTVIKNI
jgi:hypothetical protein